MSFRKITLALGEWRFQGKNRGRSPIQKLTAIKRLETWAPSKSEICQLGCKGISQIFPTLQTTLSLLQLLSSTLPLQRESRGESTQEWVSRRASTIINRAAGVRLCPQVAVGQPCAKPVVLGAFGSRKTLELLCMWVVYRDLLYLKLKQQFKIF